MKEPIRLQKFISECGIASRRKAEEMILNGEIKINGRKAVLGDKVDPKRDKVTVKGKAVFAVGEKKYIMLNKPRGFVTTMSDEQNRKCVADLVENVGTRVYPVGRLDKDSEGLILLTNDGDFAETMMHPRYKLDKTYRVTVREKVSEDQLTSLMTGIVLDERPTAQCNVEVLEQGDSRTVLLFVISEGRNRQIRRMCEAVGLTVIRLKRIAVGTVKLGMLPVGKWRELKEQEVKALIALGAKSDVTKPKKSNNRRR